LHIKEYFTRESPAVSFEMFPPKKDADIAGIYAALEEMASLAPDFISVTYGAGGGAATNRTAMIAKDIQQRYGIPAMAHLTCITADRARIGGLLDELRSQGIENVLALRGDIPAGGSADFSGDYRHAEDLIREIRSRGDFCIGAACYPEGHIDCESTDLDLERMQRKEDAGADFFVSQLFFENGQYFRFLEKARARGIKLPITAGVMPFLGRAQIERMIFMCGASLPSRIIKLLHRYENDPVSLRQAGIRYAAEQLEGLLAGGVDGVHIYTMNKSDIAGACMRHIGRV